MTPPAPPGPGARPRARSTAVLDVLVVLACAAVVLGAALTGRSARKVLVDPSVVRCTVPEDALVVWRRAGVHGRVLFHFARNVAMSPEPGPPSPSDYLARALREGIVRRVYHVIPDDAWAEVRATLSARPDAVRRGQAFALQKAGAPVLVVPRNALPVPDEPALVTIEGDRWSPEALAEIASSLRGPLRHDLVTWYAKSPDRVRALEALGRATP